MDPNQLSPPDPGEVILIDKPLRWTSFDVTKKLKFAGKFKKIGHAGTLDPLTATDLAKSFGIKVYTIAVGKDGQEAKIDENTLRDMAKEGNGQFFRASDNQTLKNIFEQINRLEKVKIKDNVYRDVEDFYYIYLNWAVVFLLAAFFFKNTFIGNILED